MKLKQIIENELKKNPDGLSISDIQRITLRDRVAIKVALGVLIGEGKIRERVVGNALLHYLKSEDAKK